MEKGKNKKDSSKEDKAKDSKIEEQILKSLDQNASIEDRFQALLQKQVESEREIRRLKQEQKVHEKQIDAVTREKDNLQKELNRSVLIRNKLTEVAREQQKMIKSLKNESMQQLKEEEDRRKESQHKFQTSLEEISQSLNKNNEENIKLRDYNIEMTKKLKFLAEQYQTREQQMEKLNEQIDLENQIHQAKLNKLQVQAAMEKEILTKEKQIALEKLLQAQKSIKDLTEREQTMKEQISLYTAKYDDFQSSLQKSNDIFASYKAELDKMSKNTRKLEKEALEWKRRWEKSNATLIELATEKKDRDEHAVRCNKQVEQLQKLLRALQSERTHLYKCIRENNIECPPLPQLPPEPEPMKTAPIIAEKDKLDIMSKNCADLKQSLASLQNQMKILSTAEQATKTEQLKLQEDAMMKKRQKRQKQRQTKEKNNSDKDEKIKQANEDLASCATTSETDSIQNLHEQIDEASNEASNEDNEKQELISSDISNELEIEQQPDIASTSSADETKPEEAASDDLVESNESAIDADPIEDKETLEVSSSPTTSPHAPEAEVINSTEIVAN